MGKIAAVQTLLSGFCFGFLGVWGKWAFSLGLTFGELLGIRFLIASFVLMLFLFWRERRRPNGARFPWLASRQELLLCVALGTCGYAVFSSFYFYALSGLSVSLTVLLLYLYPVMVAVGGRIFLGERLGRRGRWALPLAVTGTALLVWGEFSVQNAYAFLSGVMSALTYSFYILISRKKLAKIDPVVATAWIQFGTGTVIFLLHFQSAERTRHIFEVAWQPILGISLISSVLAMTLFQMGLKHLKAAEASILNTSEPLTAILVASIFLGEHLRLGQILGGALVISAMMLITLRQTKTPDV